MLYEREMLENFRAFTAFRKRCRLELVFMLVYDLYIGTGFLLTPVKTFATCVLSPALWAVKILMPIFARGRLYCVLGAAVCAAELGILGYERQLDIATVILICISLAMCVLRYSRTLALGELGRLYGYPHFNGAISSSEAEHSQTTAAILDAQTVAVRTNDRLQAALRTMNESFRAKCLKIGAVVVCIGLMIFMQSRASASKTQNGIENAAELKSLSETYDGEYVKSVTAHIYAMQVDSFDGLPVVYWAEVAGECVSLEVPNELRERFDVMEKYYSRGNVLGADGSVGSPGEDIAFVAIVHGRKHGDKQYFNTVAFERQSLDKSAVPNTEKRLEVVKVEDRQKYPY